MAILDFWKTRRERRRKAFVQQAEDFAGSIQLEIVKHAAATLATRYGNEVAMTIAAGVSNFVCRFGYVNPVHTQDKKLLALFESERSGVLRTMQPTFKTNATGVLILLGAAWSVDHPKFIAHLSLLANEGFATVGRDTPDVSRSLPQADRIYMYECLLIDRDAKASQINE